MSKFQYCWIWFWYNDITRLCIIVGLPVIPIVFITAYFFGWGEYLRTVAACSYIFFFGWALMDNDYSNLRKIGLDEYCKPLKMRGIE